MNDPAASSGVSSSLLGRHSVLDTESSRVFWIPAFAGMTNSPQAAGNTTRRDLMENHGANGTEKGQENKMLVMNCTAMAIRGVTLHRPSW
jgi:hypothetical protein